jgi:hypothetical protein
MLTSGIMLLHKIHPLSFWEAIDDLVSPFYSTTQRHILIDNILHSHSCENLKFSICRIQLTRTTWDTIIFCSYFLRLLLSIQEVT